MKHFVLEHNKETIFGMTAYCNNCNKKTGVYADKNVILSLSKGAFQNLYYYTNCCDTRFEIKGNEVISDKI